MEIKVEYYGLLADKIDRKSEILNQQEFEEWESVSAFFNNKYPLLKELNYKVAVNNKLTDSICQEESIKEIALLPPFAGG
jgi:molybdopterin converting factor small subunit